MISPDDKERTGAQIAVVLIGRNEGGRLQRALAAAQGEAVPVVYVDSGSTDGSAALAEAAGAKVVALDMSVPFSAARARNAGFAALAPMPEFVQFLDGDCALEPGWLARGAAALRADPGLAMVTGWRTELFPDRNLYHAIAETEWHRPPGPITSSNGDMMLRSADFVALGGFNPAVICAEDDELCLRLDAAGRRMLRLPEVMSHHDIAMDRLGQWWRRAVRAGHGFAQVATLHPGAMRRQIARAWGWGLALPLATLIAAIAAPWGLLLLGVYPASWLRTALGLRHTGLGWRQALGQAGLFTLSKFPNLWGLLTYHRRRMRGAAMELIEYK